VAKAELAEIELQKARRRVLLVEEADRIYGETVGPIKAALAKLAKRYGPDSRHLMEKALEAAEDVFRRGLSGDDDNS
jgi:hypothetical protein